MRLNLGSFLYPGLQEMVQPSIPRGQCVDAIRNIISSWKGLTRTTIHTHRPRLNSIIFKQILKLKKSKNFKL